ncbi:MAG: 1-acyl-sn-glycerol-3-phosphate acyltransferase [Spirochaetota bacterium]
MQPISINYREHLMKMMSRSKAQLEVGEHNVFQEGNPEILPFIDRIIEDVLLPDSTILHSERLVELMAASKAGEPCLLLLEHFSNFDLPVLHYLIRKVVPGGKDIADAIVAIAGIKLNEANPVVAAFSEAYTRLVIYPSRAVDSLRQAGHGDPAALVAELMRSVAVNRRSMRVLGEIKTQGKLILVFPSGTRYRPGVPDLAKGVREIDSYIKSFSKMCMVSINGSILRLNPAMGEMQEDLLCEDRVILDVHGPHNCDDFREKVKHAPDHHLIEDRKQAVADQIMAELREMHEAVDRDYPPLASSAPTASAPA